MSHQTIIKDATIFQNGHTDIDDAEHEGRPSTETNSEIPACMNECIQANTFITIDKISNELHIFLHINVHKIITE